MLLLFEDTGVFRLFPPPKLTDTHPRACSFPTSDLRPADVLALLRKSDDLAMAVEQACDALDLFECAAAERGGAVADVGSAVQTWLQQAGLRRHGDGCRAF